MWYLSVSWWNVIKETRYESASFYLSALKSYYIQFHNTDLVNVNKYLSHALVWTVKPDLKNSIMKVIARIWKKKMKTSYTCIYCCHIQKNKQYNCFTILISLKTSSFLRNMKLILVFSLHIQMFADVSISPILHQKDNHIKENAVASFIFLHCIFKH